MLKKLSNLGITIFLSLSLVYTSCSSNDNGGTNPIDENHEVTLKIFYTNDEHGWLEPTETNNGAGGMMTMWKTNQDYQLEGNNLVLSGGDMWTGPAISTWFKGEPMTEVMDAMGYDAAALGNHEFDFSQDGLRQNLSQMNFPILAANIKSTVTGTYPDFVQPYIILERAGIKIGIIGLTSSSTIAINFPENVKDLELTSYTDALNEIVPVVKNQGAELLILLAHASYVEMVPLKSLIQNLGISIVGCGHSHSYYIEETNNFALFEAKSSMLNYAYVEVEYDTLQNTLLGLDAELFDNNISYTSDPTIQNIVTNWQHQMDNELAEVIGYTATGIERSSQEMKNMIADSWLNTFADATISMSNYGGVRQGIPAGNITKATLVGVLPFDNNIIKLDLTGMQIKSTISSLGLFVGGLNVRDNYTLDDGSTLNDNTTYTILITDYIYYTDDNLQQYDSTPELTSMNWRDPVINWIRSLNTSSSDPLENHLDSTVRQDFILDILY